MRDLDEPDVVQVGHVRTPDRDVEGTTGISRQPIVGDRGAIVYVLDQANFLVEYVDSEFGQNCEP